MSLKTPDQVDVVATIKVVRHVTTQIDSPGTTDVSAFIWHVDGRAGRQARPYGRQFYRFWIALALPAGDLQLQAV